MIRKDGPAGQIGADGLTEQGEIRRAMRVGRGQRHQKRYFCSALWSGGRGRYHRGRFGDGSVSELDMPVADGAEGNRGSHAGVAGDGPGGAPTVCWYRSGRHPHCQRPGVRFRATGTEVGPTYGCASVVVAKVPSSDEVSRLTGFATRTFELEASFYNELAATVWVSRPSCYLAHYSLPQEGYVVLLEDMLPPTPATRWRAAHRRGRGGDARAGRLARSALGRPRCSTELARTAGVGVGADPGPRAAQPVRGLCGPLRLVLDRDLVSLGEP